MPDQWLNRGWRGSASDRVLIHKFAYTLLPLSIKLVSPCVSEWVARGWLFVGRWRLLGGLVVALVVVVSSLVALVVSSLVSGRVELEVEVEGRVAEVRRRPDRVQATLAFPHGPTKPAISLPRPEHQQFPSPIPR